MSEGCKVLATVTVEGLAYFGKSPQAGAYVCASSMVYFPVSSPAVCSAATVATTVGKWASTDAGKKLLTMATEKGCDLFVYAGTEVTKFVVVQGKASAHEIQQKAQMAKKTFRALNTPQGMHWLMQYLSSM
ncbi:MAG: hypothetical protein KDC57_01050 [Saprospiraceae bacterium]|nr:hypothetical protein [Saprospiraceae bacterium]